MSYSRQRKDPAQKQQEYFIKQLEQILRLPGNDNCADCGQKGPRWASVNLGVFVCIRCSGIHRNMGTHISKVKSVSLDKWQPDMVEQVRRIGNINAKRIYEGRLPANYQRPRENDAYAIEQWIRDKYDRKRWYDSDAAIAVISGATQEKPQKSQKSKRREPKSQPKAQPKPKAQPTPNLFDVSTPTPSAQPAAPTQPAVDLFSDFQTPSSQGNNQADFFGNESAAFFNQSAPSQPTPQQPTQPTPSQPAPQVNTNPTPAPVDAKADIMSLFRQQQMGGNQGMNTLFGGNQMSGNQMGGNQMNMGNQMGMNNMYGNQMGNQMGGNQMNMGMNNMYGNNQMGNNQMGMNNMYGNNQMSMNQMGMNQMGMNQMGMNQMSMNQANMGGQMNQMGQTRTQNNQNVFNW